MEDGAGPIVAPEYMGVWRAGATSWGAGDTTPIEIPSDSAYGEFDEVDDLPGTEEKPSTTFIARYPRDQASVMLRLRRRRCYHDMQLHLGACQDLRSFNLGWDKIIVYEHAFISSYGTDDLGSLSSDERAVVNENIAVQSRDYYEILKIAFAAICASTVIQEVLAVAICDAKTCGECGAVSDGCQKVFGLVTSVGGSPGLGAQVVFTEDGGSTCDADPITTLAANEVPDDLVCFGDNIVVVSEDSLSHHYTDRDELLLGTNTWAEVVANYNAAGGPRCAFTLKPGYCWIGGAGGYVYFLENVGDGPTVQDAGAATTQDLNDAHAFDEEHVVMVGDSNAVIYTTDGSTWTAVTGPAIAVNLNAVWMTSETEWWVGTAGGQLFYTRNSGATWTEKQFPGSGAGQVRDIVFATKQVGYLAHDNAIAGTCRLLRTINGGYSWYVMPETGTMPAAAQINSIATCDPNVLFAGGLADDGIDGIMLKAA